MTFPGRFIDLYRPHDSFRRAFGLHHNSFRFQSPADTHGDSLKKKLESTKSLAQPKQISLLTASAHKLLPKPPPDLTLSGYPTQLPFRPRTYDSSHSDPQHTSADSSGSVIFQHHGDIGYRPTLNLLYPNRSTRGSTKNDCDAAFWRQGSFAYGYAEEMEMNKRTELKRLRLSDRYATVGKRWLVAKPPSPSESVSLSLQRNADLGSSSSPTSRLTNFTQSPPRPLSSSDSHIRFSSTTTSVSITTHKGRLHGGVSSNISPPITRFPSMAPLSPPTSLHSTFNSGAPVHATMVLPLKPPSNLGILPELQEPFVAKGFSICECCPQKPKRFKTDKELR